MDGDDSLRVAFMSDAHLEITFSKTFPYSGLTPPLSLVPGLRALEAMRPDILLLAGDMGAAMPWSPGFGAVECAAALADRLGCPTLLVPGNHEYYGTEMREALARMREAAAARPGVFVLDRDEWAGQVRGLGLRVLGATLWTDYACSGDRVAAMRACELGMNDHRQIRLARTSGPPTPLRAADLLEEHRLSRAWLLDRLSRPFDGATVVLSHHVPHTAFRNRAYAVDHLGAGFMSDLDDVIGAASDAGAAAWVFGHHHACVEGEALGVLFGSAQPGYWAMGERTGWKGPGLILIDADGRAAFAESERED